MAENQNFQCSGNCLNCIPAQRVYCASQHTYKNMRTLEQILSEVASMKEDIKSFEDKIETIQNNEASVFDPNMVGVSKHRNGKEISDIDVMPTEMPTEIAQEGDGAEE